MDAEQHPASITLALDSLPACVTLVRSMVSGLGELLELDAELIDDIKTAVSEACNNVVIHAYPDRPGPLAVALAIRADGLEITVVDHGPGIRHIAATEDRMGVGMAVISALADTTAFSGTDGGGTTVRMSFGSRGRALSRFTVSAAGQAPGSPELSGDVMLTVAPVALLGDVLGRVTRAIAAGAHFSIDRFADLYLIIDELAAHVDGAALSGSITCAISAQSGRLDLRLGTFASSALRARLDNGAGTLPLRRLVNELQIEPAGAGEVLAVTVIDARRGPHRA